jgi:DNA uptake protein ComE-like DNA-binding protein
VPDRIDINAASEEELVEVLQIDEATAARIAELRARQGGIRAAEDLAGLAGVDGALLQRVREHLIVDAPVGSEAAPPGR